MYGAIVGDVLGSVHERVPHLPARIRHEPTDDSVLTCACYQWCQDITAEQLATLNERATRVALYRSACDKLVQWRLAFAQPNAFSKGFALWVQQVQGGDYQARSAPSNGCLMRSSPISEFCYQKGLSRPQRQLLISLFTRTTHNHKVALQATLEHSDLIVQSFDVLHGRITKAELLQDYREDIRGVAHWQQQAHHAPWRFLWKAQESWHIALSGLALSDSFEGMLDFFERVGGDVDTYAAIAGPIAQNLFDMHQAVARVRTILAHPELAQFGPVRVLVEKMLPL